MAFFVNEQKMIEDNIFKYENRLNTQLSRFLDKSPVFVTYYHLNVNESTVDGGFKDIDDIVSESSPLKFQKISNFPIYGLEPVQLALNDEEQGLDTSYSSSAIILPNTIKPLQNDFFTINHVKGSFMFRVTEIQYDTIRPDNYYQINYRFEYCDEEKEEQINTQVHEKYDCILENIGTESNCIIMDEYKEQIDKLTQMYSDMVSTYKNIFYNKRYNCFVAESSEMSGYKVFDPLQSVFINKNRLINEKNNYETIILTSAYDDNKRDIKYERSFYRLFERRDIKASANSYGYVILPGIDIKDSVFAAWQDNGVIVADVPPKGVSGQCTIIPYEIINAFKYNAPQESVYLKLMQKFVRNEDVSIYDIPLTLNEELLYLDANEEVYFITPILLYIIKTVISDFLKTKKYED